MRSSSIFLALAVLISSAAAQSPVIDYGTTDETFMDDTQDDVGFVPSTYDTGETLTVSADDDVSGGTTDDQLSGDDVNSISPGAEEEPTPSPVESTAGDPTPAPGEAAGTTITETPVPASDADPFTPAPVPTPAPSMKASTSPLQTPTLSTALPTAGSSSPVLATSFPSVGPTSDAEASDSTGSARGWFTSHDGGWRAALTFVLAGALGASLRRGWLFERMF